MGGVIGFEREFSDQTAGFRTHILVALGSALFTMVGAYGLSDFADNDNLRFDPTRIAAQIVTGIGFLGAGAILQKGIRIRGLTTAAALWVTAAIGMAAGFGYWAGAVGTTVISLVALSLLKVIENRFFLFKDGQAQLALDAEHGFNLGRLEETLVANGATLHKVEMSTTRAGHHLAASLKFDAGLDVEELISHVSDLPDVSKVQWKGPGSQDTAG